VLDLLGAALHAAGLAAAGPREEPALTDELRAAVDGACDLSRHGARVAREGEALVARRRIALLGAGAGPAAMPGELHLAVPADEELFALFVAGESPLRFARISDPGDRRVARDVAPGHRASLGAPALEIELELAAFADE